MKKWITMMFVLTISIFSCGQDNKDLATYEVGGKKKTVTLGEVKKAALPYIERIPRLAADVTQHKEYVMERLIYPDVMVFEAIQSGLTNDSDFKKEFEQQYHRSYLQELRTIGFDKMTNEMKKAKYEIARASHILIKYPTSTNVNGQVLPLDEEQLNQAKEIAKMKAANLIQSLKGSKSLDKEFSAAAQKDSEDPGSKMKGGDLGYFIRNTMVKEFENAVFNAKSKGVVGEPVETIHGFHIIYVTDPVSRQDENKIKKLVGEQKFRGMSWALQRIFFQDLQENQIKTNYMVEGTNDEVMVGGKAYPVMSLPEDVKLVEIFTIPYTWKDAKDVIMTFVPSFTNYNAEQFARQMENFKGFMLFVAKAKKMGLDNTAKFKEKAQEMRDSILKDVIRQKRDEMTRKKAEEAITEEDMQKYYEAMKVRFVEPVKGADGKPVRDKDNKIVNRQLTFAEAKDRVKRELTANMAQEYVDNWKSEAKEKYKINMIEENFNALKEILSAELAKIQKQREAQRKKQEAEQKKREAEMRKKSQQQPQQIKIKPQPGQNNGQPQQIQILPQPGQNGGQPQPSK